MIKWFCNIKTVSESNRNEHWAYKHARHKSQKNHINALFLIEKPEIKLPCNVKVTRFASRKLDSDNLQTAFKWIRDAISENIIKDKRPGMADNDDRITWIYDQKTVKRDQIGIGIEIY